jgi:hypothetical protein
MSTGAGTRADFGAPIEAGLRAPDDLIARLRELSLVVDILWQDALNKPGDSQALEIGEASQGLHLAMIALDSVLGKERLPHPVVTAQ